MDFLNKYFAQIRELFEGMTPGARITSALLLAVTVASLGYLFTSGFNPGGDVYLLDNRAFPSDELAAMEGAFAAEGLGDYEIVAGSETAGRASIGQSHGIGIGQINPPQGLLAGVLCIHEQRLAILRKRY